MGSLDYRLKPCEHIKCARDVDDDVWNRISTPGSTPASFFIFFDFCVGLSMRKSTKAIYANAVYRVVVTRRPPAGIPVPESGARYSVTVREHDVVNIVVGSLNSIVKLS